MRRRDKEITDNQEIAAILKKALFCRIALFDGEYPYIVPVNFVVSGKYLYFHSGTTGKKIDLLKKNNAVCFEIDTDTEIAGNNVPCSWSMRYLSVIGYGRASFLKNADEKIRALNYLMEKYAGDGAYSYQPEVLDKVVIVRIIIEKITGKKSGF